MDVLFDVDEDDDRTMTYEDDYRWIDETMMMLGVAGGFAAAAPSLLHFFIVAPPGRREEAQSTHSQRRSYPNTAKENWE